MANEVWISIEPAADADEQRLVETIETEGVPYEATHDGTLVFTALCGPPRLERVLTGDVVDHLNRALVVVHNDSAGGTTGRYYEVDDGQLRERDVVDIVGPIEMAVFDYFAREYGIHVPA